MASLTPVSDSDFDAEVLKAELPVLVDFWAEWCVPCRTMVPHLEKLAAEHANKVKFVALDVQNSPDIPARYCVISLPTLILFVGGEPKERLQGFAPEKKIVQRLARYLS